MPRTPHTSSLLLFFFFTIGHPSEIIPILTGLRTDKNEQQLTTENLKFEQDVFR